jgi:hypothetical protein
MSASDALSRYVIGAAMSGDQLAKSKKSQIQTGHGSWTTTHELKKDTLMA